MMGTGTFALPTFRRLCDSGHEVVGLVTQPDRAGRGHHRHPHPMKEEAVARGIDVFQPERANEPESLERLRDYRADVFVVAAYGQILSADLLRIPRLGAINLHASLLPKYRGAAPIQFAVWRGEAETGVTIFRIEPKLDAGPILGVVRTPIGPDDTSGSLEDRLAELASPLTLDILSRLEAGTASPLPQDRTLVSRAPKLDKSAGQIDWSRSAREIDCHVRAMQPWPMPFTFLHAPGHPPQRLLVTKVAGEPTAGNQSATPGAVVAADRSRLLVACSDGAIEVLRVQPAGKREMDAAEFLRGRPLGEGCRFGQEVP
jgi:methionyl-tRNA formyltransferase